MVIMVAGIIPELPAVGAATILPMAALTSDVDRAMAIAMDGVSPRTLSPPRKYSFIFLALPPVMPVTLLTSSSRARCADAFITSKVF